MNVVVTADRKISIPLDNVVGSFRTFGPLGPKYEVLGIGMPAVSGAVTLAVRVVESGETLDYPLEQAIQDPLAA